MSEVASPVAESGRLAELRSSAKGWHGVQLAVLGFIGLCGVIKQETPSTPDWLETLAAVMVLAALVIACAATFLVGRAAWPLYGARDAVLDEDDPGEIARTAHRLRRGLALTFLAVALLGLGAASAWWPSDDTSPAAGGGGANVELQAGGQRFCGTLADARPGSIGVDTGDGPVVVPAGAVSALRPVGGC